MDQEQRKAALIGVAALQDEELALAQVERELGRVPEQIASIEKSLRGAEAALADAREAVAQAGKERRALEQEIEAIKVVISRYQGQLLEVKTNEQYRLLNQEITTQKRKIEAVEDRILSNMERVEELQRSIAAREAALADEKKRVVGEKATLERDRLRLEQEKGAREATRAALKAAIPAEILALFRRISETRSGIGLSRTREGACGECRVRARPQALAESRAFERVVQCESCQRILFVTEPPPRVAPMERDEEDGAEV